MQKKIVIAGAGDMLGRRLVRDFVRFGWKVYAGYIGNEPSQVAESVTAFAFDPLDHAGILAEAGKIGEAIDMLLINIDGGICCDCGTVLDEIDYDAMINAYEYNTMGPMRVVNAFLPLLEKGEGKRIGFVTTRSSSNYLCDAVTGLADHVSRAPLNMAITQLFNGLRPDGYTFRAYVKDTENGRDEWASDFFIRDRSYADGELLKHNDEDRIVLYDWTSRQIPY